MSEDEMSEDEKKRDLLNFDTYRPTEYSPFTAKISFDRSPSGSALTFIIFAYGLIVGPLIFVLPEIPAFIGFSALSILLLFLARKWESDMKFTLFLLLIGAPGFILIGRMTDTISIG